MTKLKIVIAALLMFMFVAVVTVANADPHKAPVIGHVDPTQLEQSDAGFLEGANGVWYCKTSNGSFWAWVVGDVDDYAGAVTWCAAHGYSW